MKRRTVRERADVYVSRQPLILLSSPGAMAIKLRKAYEAGYRAAKREGRKNG